MEPLCQWDLEGSSSLGFFTAQVFFFYLCPANVGCSFTGYENRQVLNGRNILIWAIFKTFGCVKIYLCHLCFQVNGPSLLWKSKQNSNIHGPSFHHSCNTNIHQYNIPWKPLQYWKSQTNCLPTRLHQIWRFICKLWLLNHFPLLQCSLFYPLPCAWPFLSFCLCTKTIFLFSPCY